MKSDIQILSVEPDFIVTKCRSPLKFGASVVEQLYFCKVRVVVRNRAGAEASGWGGIFLMDSWAFPTHKIPHEDKERAMVEIVGELVKRFAAYDGYAHPIEIFTEVEKSFESLRVATTASYSFVEEIPKLCMLVCASAIDAAIHDAFGNVNGIDTYEGYSKDYMSDDLSRYLGGQFKGKYIGDYLNPRYRASLPVFHLVGGLDILRKNELKVAPAAGDLPASLDEWVRRDGLFCLKVKLRGTDLEWDMNRMLEVAAVAYEAQQEIGASRLVFSADTNEQCDSPEYCIELLEKLRERAQRTYDELLYLEQPTERDLSAGQYDMRPLAAMKPVILDESLVGIESFYEAVRLGWSGIALKTCKCHTHALLMACLATEHKVPYTVQDLTNPGISLIHSAGLAARLHPMFGLESNSMQFFPDASREEMSVHPGLFTRCGGLLNTESLLGCGLGYQMDKIIGV